MTKRLFFAATFLAASPAFASPFVVRTSRPNYAETEVARPLAIQKEWAEYTLSYTFREVTQYTDYDGNVEDLDYTYTISMLTADLRYGFTRNLSIYMSIPYHVGTTRDGGNDGAGTVTESGMGDVRFGFLWQLLNREKGSNLSSVALQLDTKQPSGNESPGAPGNRHLMLGTGTTNAGFMLHAKQRLGPVALLGRVGYTHKFSAVTMWVRDEEGPFGLNGRFKPGNELSAGASAIVQPIRLAAVIGGVDYISRAPSSVGATSDGINPASDLDEIPDSDFEALNASAKLLLEPSVNWDFGLGVTVPVMSRNSGMFFPMEDLSQSYGTTFTGSATFRW